MRIFKSLLSLLFACILVAGVSSTASSQVLSSPGSTLAWDQPGVPAGTSPSAFTYTYAIDGGSSTSLSGSTCTVDASDASLLHCTAPMPATTTGDHTLTLTATITINSQSATGPASTPLTFTAVIILPPTNLRIIKQG